MRDLKRFLWQFDTGTSYEGLKIGIASIIPGLGLWVSGYPRYALLAAVALAISAVAFFLFPGTVLWYVMCIIWMAQLFIAVALEELKTPVDPPDSAPAQDFPASRKSVSLPRDLPKGKRLFAHVKRELGSRLPASSRLISYVAGLEDKTSQCWYLGLSEDELILFRPAQPGVPSRYKTIPRPAITWTYLLTGRRNRVLSIEYKQEDSEESQAFLLHVPGSWHKQALAIVRELPGASFDEGGEAALRKITGLSAEKGELYEAAVPFVMVGLLFLFVGSILSELLPEMIFGFPGDGFLEFAVAIMFYLTGWPFALRAIRLLRYSPTINPFINFGYVHALIGASLWLFAISLSDRVISQVIHR